MKMVNLTWYSKLTDRNSEQELNFWIAMSEINAILVGFTAVFGNFAIRLFLKIYLIVHRNQRQIQTFSVWKGLENQP